MFEKFEDAARYGWQLVHAEEARLEQTSGDHFTRFDGHFRAEKRHEGALLTFEAGTLEKLLAKLHAWENWGSRSTADDEAPAPPAAPAVAEPPPATEPTPLPPAPIVEAPPVAPPAPDDAGDAKPEAAA